MSDISENGVGRNMTPAELERAGMSEIPEDLKKNWNSAEFLGEPACTEYRKLIERIAKLTAENALLRQNHPFGAMYDALKKAEDEQEKSLAIEDSLRAKLETAREIIDGTQSWRTKRLRSMAEKWLAATEVSQASSKTSASSSEA